MAAASQRTTVSLPSLPHLRRDMVLSLTLGGGLTVVLIVVGLATG
jgi:hypothetical protein